MKPEQLINDVAREVRKQLSGESSGHDWWHIHRVVQTGKRIAAEEGANALIVELALLLHDIADYKFNNGDHEKGPRLAGEILRKFEVDESTISQVCDIISRISFKGKSVGSQADTLEAKICEDADRLDAIGAIGIARAFATGAKFNEVFHDPEVQVPLHQTVTDYSEAKGKPGRTVINHFHEKLLLLKERMNTETAKKLARQRHEFMITYLDQFHEEWNGER